MINRIQKVSRELKFFAAASLFMGMATSIIDATFNNFLNEQFQLTGFERSFLEFPREMPGLLVIVSSALLWFLCSRRLSAASLFLGAIGALLIGFMSTSYTVMVVWLFIYSTGQHLFMPLSSVIGMELARDGKTGRRLGQLNAIRNLAAVMGSFVVFLGFRFLSFSFQHTFVLAALGFLLASALLLRMKREKVQRPNVYFKLHREYRLYYVLAILYGSRKQVFMTFAPWVLVTIFNQPTQLIATLLTIGGINGIIFQPFLGWSIDRFGERTVLISEALILVVVCFSYGFARTFFSENIAFLITCGCFLVDQMMMSVNMARATYMKKIALRPEDVQPALTMAVSLDHIFSISVALIGGLIWNAFGYRYVFLMGAAIAFISLFAAVRIRLPQVLTMQEPEKTVVSN